MLENNYEAKGQMIELDTTMQAYQIGSGSKMVVWSHDIFGLTGENSGNGRTKEWADFLAENGYNVLVPGSIVETTCLEEHLDHPPLLGVPL